MVSPTFLVDSPRGKLIGKSDDFVVASGEPDEDIWIVDGKTLDLPTHM